jgi:hypothetical protein
MKILSSIKNTKTGLEMQSFDNEGHPDGEPQTRYETPSRGRISVAPQP